MFRLLNISFELGADFGDAEEASGMIWQRGSGALWAPVLAMHGRLREKANPQCKLASPWRSGHRGSSRDMYDTEPRVICLRFETNEHSC